MLHITAFFNGILLFICSSLIHFTFNFQLSTLQDVTFVPQHPVWVLMAVVMDQAKVNQGVELVSAFLDLREVEIPDYEKIASVVLPGIGVKQEDHESPS